MLGVLDWIGVSSFFFEAALLRQARSFQAQVILNSRDKGSEGGGDSQSCYWRLKEKRKGMVVFPGRKCYPIFRFQGPIIQRLVAMVSSQFNIFISRGSKSRIRRLIFSGRGTPTSKTGTWRLQNAPPPLFGRQFASCKVRD